MAKVAAHCNCQHPESAALLHSVGSERRRHRSLIDVIQDLEQEHAAEVASSGVSPASDRPVPLDLSGAISDPVDIPSTSGQHGQGQPLEQPPVQPHGLPHHMRPSDDGSEPVPCPPGEHLSWLVNYIVSVRQINLGKGRFANMSCSA